jgi:hypothetical protein
VPVITVELPEQEIERLTVEARRRNMSLPEHVAEQVKRPANGSETNDASEEIGDGEFKEIVAQILDEDMELLRRLA